MSDKKIDCAYIFYTRTDSKPLLESLTAPTIALMCDDTHGVIRTKGVICESTQDNIKKFTITTKGGQRLGVNTPDFAAGVKIYGVALVASGYIQTDDILIVSTELTQMANMPAGADIAITITTEDK